MNYLLSTNCLTKQYKRYKAVNEVSIHIKKGEIYGFIGRNGAGKTTFLRMISGLAEPDSGEIKIFGHKGKELRESNVFSRIGILIESPGVYSDMTAFQNIKMKCSCYGIKDKTYMLDLLGLVGLESTGKKIVKNFSLGMRQRLGIALALVGDPELLVLDEPINGLDPQGIAEVRDIIIKLNQERNITIIISSHILDELYKIATVYGIISNGQLLQELTRDELDEKCNKKIEIKVDNSKKACLMLDEMGIRDYKLIDEQTLYVLERLEESAEINKTLVEAGIRIKSICVKNDSLEDFYFNLTGGVQHA